MAKNLTPEEVAQKQIQNAKNNVDSWKKGVQRTQKRPMELAVRAIPKMKANFNKAVDDGSVKEGLEAVSHGEWVDMTITKGEPNYSVGLDASLSRQVAFQQQREQFIKATQSEIDAMPTLTKADRKAKMNANFERMERFKFKRRLRK